MTGSPFRFVWRAFAKLEAYRRRLRERRGLPAALRTVLEQIPASAHPMDVLRTGCSMLGVLEPEAAGHGAGGARDIADRLLAVFPSILLYWHHFATAGRRMSASAGRVHEVLVKDGPSRHA